eukprot:7417905-Pyramimonas_sp.AAC.1
MLSKAAPRELHQEPKRPVSGDALLFSCCCCCSHTSCSASLSGQWGEKLLEPHRPSSELRRHKSSDPPRSY